MGPVVISGLVSPAWVAALGAVVLLGCQNSALQPQPDGGYDGAVDPGRGWSGLSAGEFFTCGVRKDGGLYCWGDGEYGQLGDGMMGFGNLKTAPSRVGQDSDWREVSAGWQHVCALKLNGELHCWGKNDYGQLGEAPGDIRTLPLRVGSDRDWRAVEAGYYHNCARKESGAIYCWGWDAFGQLGDGQLDEARANPVPTQVGTDSDWGVFASGSHHTCALKPGGALYCWGANHLGQLGDGTAGVDAHKPTPTRIGADQEWAAAAPGYLHTCARTQSGGLFCWGEGRWGKLGDGTGLDRLTPAMVSGAGSWRDVFASYSHTCGVRESGELYCWGFNFSGELGDGTSGMESAKATPVRSGADALWRQVVGGSGHTCALKDDGAAWCWGANGFGNLGDGTQQARLTPTPVADP